MHLTPTRIRFLLPFFTVLLTLFISANSHAASAVKIPFDIAAKDREQAEWLAVVDSTQQALKKYMKSRALDESTRLKVEEKLSQIKPREYKPLVRKWNFETDQKAKKKYYLEGQIILDNDVLTLWAEDFLKDQDQDNDHRLTLYVSPVTADDMLSENLDLQNRKELMNALVQQLSQFGYSFKTNEQRSQAQYVLELQDSRYQRDGLKGTIGFTVAILENRSDRSLLGKANGSANASQVATELELKKRLFQLSATKVGAELHRTFASLASSDLEFVFYAPEKISRRNLKKVKSAGFDLLAEAGGFISDEDFELFEKNVDSEIFESDRGQSISYLIKNKLNLNIPDLHESLVTIQKELFGSSDVDVKRGQAGKKWLVFNSDAAPEEIGGTTITDPFQVKVELLIKQGKLTHPQGIGSNAFDTLADQLRSAPSNKDAINQLNRVAELLISNAEAALPIEVTSSSQLNTSRRYSVEANRVLNSEHAKPSQSLKKRFAQIQQKLSSAVKKQKQKIEQQRIEATSNKPQQMITQSNPKIVFPGLENNLRGLQRKKQPKIIAVLADYDGIESVSVNSKSQKFIEADKKNQSYLNIPGATNYQIGFSQKIADSSGEIQVDVVDTLGNKATRVLQIKKGKAEIVVPNNLDKGRKVLEKGRFWALLISNQNYVHTSKLRTPHNDADSLRTVLQEYYGYQSEHIVQLKDASKLEMHKALDKMQDRVKGNDSLLIYYAGHGFQDKGFGGKGFWIPVDGMSPTAEDSPRTSWLPNSTVHDILEASNARHVLLISDSCYSGTFKTRDLPTREEFSSDLEFFYTLAAKKSRRAITSGDIEPVLDGGGKGHSVFAQQLIDTLTQSQHSMNATRLFDLIQKPVESRSEEVGHLQSPQFFPIKTAGDDDGDFIFMNQKN